MITLDEIKAALPDGSEVLQLAILCRPGMDPDVVGSAARRAYVERFGGAA